MKMPTIMSKHKAAKNLPFSLSFTNIRSINSNFSSVEAFLSNSSPDFLALSETNLSPNIADSDFSIPGYLPIIRKDSSTHMHGLAVYARETLPISRETHLEKPTEPFMCFRLSLLHSTSYLFFLYRSPSSQDCTVVDSVSQSIDSALTAHPSANIFVFGDFNVHHGDWLKHDRTDAAGIHVRNFAISQSLHQTVDFVTRIPDRDDHSPSLLDLFLTSNPTICQTSSSSALGKSDHVVVNILVNLNTKAAQESPFHRTLYSYDRGDWDSFRDFLRDAPWSDVFKLDGEKCAEEVASWIKAGIDGFIPYRKFQQKPHSSPWFSPACAAAIAHRNHFYKVFQREQSTASKRRFRQAANECKRVIESAKSQYVQRTQERIATQKIGSRDFWRIYNSISNKGKSTIPPLINGPEVLTTSKDKAEHFAQRFSRNSNLDDTGHPLPEFEARTHQVLRTISITPKKVAAVIRSLDPSKATGPDGIPVVVLQRCCPEISSILSKLFNKLLTQSCFPSCWKVPNVIAAFKNSGDRSDSGNYRPISLLPIISKVFESLMASSIIRHMDSLKLFSDCQYGFRSSRSTADVLTVISERLSRVLEAGGRGRAVALDISKAFDKVWHAGLLHKLRGYGISGNLLDIIQSFLSNRQLKVVLDGQQSSCYSINAGVPQGSVLGPILFLVFINDLPDDLLSQIAIYADDTTVYDCRENTDEFSMCEQAGSLQLDLEDIVEWGEKWLVTFNAAKTKLLSVSRCHKAPLTPISMNDRDLPENDSFRLLGLTFSKSLTWNEYVETIAKSAAQKVGSLYRARAYLTPESILYLYKASIRPCMEYCCHLWAGAPAHLLNLLDRIQNRVSNMIGPQLSLKLQPLSHRRDVASLSLFYKYFHGHCSEELASLVPSRKIFTCKTRLAAKAHEFTVEEPLISKNFRRSSFFPRTSRIWNSLSSDCFPPSYNLQSFKCSVNKYLLQS